MATNVRDRQISGTIVIVWRYGHDPSAKPWRQQRSAAKPARHAEGFCSRSSARTRQQTTLRSNEDSHGKCTRCKRHAGLGGIHWTSTYAPEFRNRRGSVVSSGVSQPPSISEARSGNRFYEALPRILANFLCST